jgi:putative flippase GtrA
MKLRHSALFANLAKINRKEMIESIIRGSDVSIFHRAFRHLVAGGIGTLIYIGLVAAGVEILALHPVTSAVAAFIVLEIFTYAINRSWVYLASRDHHYAVPRFLIVSVVGIVLNAAIMYVIVESFGLAYGWGLLATTIVVPPTNFLLNFFWAFK